MPKIFRLFLKINLYDYFLSGSLLAEAKRPRYSGSKLSGHSEIDTSANLGNLSIPFSDLIAFRDRSNLEKIYESPQVRLGLTLRRPLRRKLRMRWFFDVSKMKESSFLNRTSLTSLQIFDVHQIML